MNPRDGDVIEFDYELWIEGQSQLYDTTLRSAAEAAGILQSNAYYAPVSYVVGSGRVIPGLERALKAAAPGQTQELTLAPADAYGERDSKRVETIALQEFKKSDVNPQVGLPITYKNRRGVILTVGGGRVRIDFNPALAGKTLKYRFTLRRIAQSDADKVAGILRMHVPLPEGWKVHMESKSGASTATVEVPGSVLFQQSWLTAKYRSLVDLKQYTNLREVRFVEAYPLHVPEPVEASLPPNASTEARTETSPPRV